jgi:hypothetical protein
MLGTDGVGLRMRPISATLSESKVRERPVTVSSDRVRYVAPTIQSATDLLYCSLHESCDVASAPVSKNNLYGKGQVPYTYHTPLNKLVKY